MKKKIFIVALDLLLVCLYSSIGLCLFLLYGFMGPESDFVIKNDIFRNIILPILIIIQLLIGLSINIYFFKSKKTKRKIKINLVIFIINILIILFPYTVLIQEVLL